MVNRRSRSATVRKNLKLKSVVTCWKGVCREMHVIEYSNITYTWLNMIHMEKFHLDLFSALGCFAVSLSKRTDKVLSLSARLGCRTFCQAQSSEHLFREGKKVKGKSKVLWSILTLFGCLLSSVLQQIPIYLRLSLKKHLIFLNCCVCTLLQLVQKVHTLALHVPA